MEAATSTATSMLRWQYSTILNQFILLQLHAEDPSCPCSLRGITSHELGEYCEPKHTRAILALARETVPMESDTGRIEVLQDIVETGTPILEEMEAKLCGKETVADALMWSRQKRKPIETIVYGMCLLNPGEGETEAKPWQMTRLEYLHHMIDQYKAAGYDPTDANRAAQDDLKIHEASVAIALEEGKPVPKEVLKDYPELKSGGAMNPGRISRGEADRIAKECKGEHIGLGIVECRDPKLMDFYSDAVGETCEHAVARDHDITWEIVNIVAVDHVRVGPGISIGTIFHIPVYRILREDGTEDIAGVLELRKCHKSISEGGEMESNPGVERTIWQVQAIGTYATKEAAEYVFGQLGRLPWRMTSSIAPYTITVDPEGEQRYRELEQDEKLLLSTIRGKGPFWGAPSMLTESPVDQAIAEAREAWKAEAERTGSVTPETVMPIAEKYNVPFDRLVREVIRDLKPVKIDDTYRVSFSPELEVSLNPEVFGVILAPEEATIPGFGEALERCILHVQASLPEWCTPEQWKKPLPERGPGCYNPYAVCRASLRAEHGLGVKGKAEISFLIESPAVDETACQVIAPQDYDLLGWLNMPVPDYSFAIEPEVRERKIDEVLERLKDGVSRIHDSALFRDFLISMAKFHHYSIGNQMLITLQRKTATRVAGIKTWNELGRYVRRGEKGITILAPCLPAMLLECPFCNKLFTEPALRAHLSEVHGWLDVSELIKQAKEKAGAIVPTPRYFKVVYVFDIEQTEGKALPVVEVPILTEAYSQELFDKLMDLAFKYSVAVSFEPRPELDPSIKGMLLGNDLWVKPDEPDAQRLKTLAHEKAHYFTENVYFIPRADAEVIAESVAFVVCAHFGFDTGVRSFPYVALWAKEKKVLEQNLASIRKISGRMIEELGE